MFSKLSYLHSGPGHAGSQTAPQYSPPLLKNESQLWFHIPPYALEHEGSVLPLHTSVALFQEDPLKIAQQSEQYQMCLNVKSFP